MIYQVCCIWQSWVDQGLFRRMLRSVVEPLPGLLRPSRFTSMSARLGDDQVQQRHLTLHGILRHDEQHGAEGKSCQQKRRRRTR